jgi:molecular chaperone GrpE (heat shock protein)
MTKVFQATSRQKRDIEMQKAEATAQAIQALLPSSDESREKMLIAGQELASAMAWTREIRQAFLPCLESLSASLQKMKSSRMKNSILQ